MVEVISPDGSKSLWVAFVAEDKAAEAVAAVIPTDHIARLCGRRLTLNRKSDQLRPGEVRRIKL